MLAVYLSALSVLSVLASGGFPAVGALVAPEYLAKNQKGLLKGLLVSARKHIFVGSAICTAAMLAYLSLSSSVGMANSVLLSSVFGAAILAAATLNLHSSVFVGLSASMLVCFLRHC